MGSVAAVTIGAVHASATIEIRTKRIDLPFTVHFSVGVKTVFNTASRISAP